MKSAAPEIICCVNRHLAAGKHEITLVNAEEGIHLTAEVAITADRSTQLIRDFTN